MILALLVFVSLGLFAALPVFAIPAPDFIGPVLAWLVAMIGILSAIFGTVAIWAKRALRSIAPRSRRSIWLIIGGFFVGLLIITVIAAAFRYQNSQQRFLMEVANLRRNLFKQQAATSTADTALNNGLISSRVPRGTILVSISDLREVVRERGWSDRITLLDIRESEEREIGMVDATTTWIRYGDLINGGADSLSKDKDILVLCWTSIRGEEIATWLRGHGFTQAYAIQGGLQGNIDKAAPGGWIAGGLPWSGKSRWSSVFGKALVMSLEEAKRLYDGGATVVDVRSDNAFTTWHIKDARSLPLETAPTTQVESVIKRIPVDEPLVIYCDGYVNCFYARVLGIRLSRLGWPPTQPFDDARRDWRILGYPSE